MRIHHARSLFPSRPHPAPKRRRLPPGLRDLLLPVVVCTLLYLAAALAFRHIASAPPKPQPAQSVEQPAEAR